MNEGLRHSNEFLEKVQTGNERLFQQAVGCALQEDKLSFSGVTKRASLQIEFGNDDEVMPLLRMADSSTVQLIGVYI